MRHLVLIFFFSPLNGDQRWHLLIKVPLPLFARHLSLPSVECEGLGLIRSPSEIFPPSVLRRAWLPLHHDKPKYVGWDPVFLIGWTLNGLTDSLLFCFLIHYITVVSAAALLVKTAELKGEDGQLPKSSPRARPPSPPKCLFLRESQSQIFVEPDDLALHTSCVKEWNEHFVIYSSIFFKKPKS